eukprot:CAMPEP_0202691604 /NCGR_PEP_ID=MMETSP1385-20130828/6276_1 /ASSEMBLY_ACC=CAM_ASM_000861 /TAXON_ID=933848 /ORGANISM="Elphidium margaritaceum" /LENGTH=173 /DNA_ID=CAMNT_0049347037 /DNA_START=26 /DNA_END=544 /DNA_ORIENTATION=+
MLQRSLLHQRSLLPPLPSLQYESKRFGWRRRKRRSQRALAERRKMGIQSMGSQRENFPDIYPTDDNWDLYQSFMEKYKLGLIFNEVLRLKYYNTLFPAMETMQTTLSDSPPSADVVSTHTQQMSQTETSPSDTLADNDENEESDGYEYEYEEEYEPEYEYEDDEFEGDEEDTK